MAKDTFPAQFIQLLLNVFQFHLDAIYETYIWVGAKFV